MDTRKCVHINPLMVKPACIIVSLKSARTGHMLSQTPKDILARGDAILRIHPVHIPIYPISSDSHDTPTDGDIPTIHVDSDLYPTIQEPFSWLLGSLWIGLYFYTGGYIPIRGQLHSYTGIQCVLTMGVCSGHGVVHRPRPPGTTDTPIRSCTGLSADSYSPTMYVTSLVSLTRSCVCPPPPWPLPTDTHPEKCGHRYLLNNLSTNQYALISIDLYSGTVNAKTSPRGGRRLSHPQMTEVTP